MDFLDPSAAGYGRVIADILPFQASTYSATVKSLATSKPQIVYESNNHRDYRFWTLTGDVSLSISYVSHYLLKTASQFYL